jgi:tetratricopeptide (TPR) repeat protein
MAFGSTLLSLLLLPLALQSPQDTIRRHHEAAEAHARAGDLAAAEAEYAAILAEASRGLVRSLSARKRHAEALAAAESAARLRPDSADALVDVALARFNAREYEQALEPLRRAVALDARNAAARNMLGRTWFALEDYDRAAEELESAWALAPNDFDTAFTLAISYLERRRVPETKRVFERMLQQFGDRPQIRVVIGRAYREAGLFSDAIEQFKRAIALDPALPRGHFNLGLAYLKNEGVSALADAEAEFKAELASNPDEYLANYYLGIVYIFEREWAPAVEHLLRAARARPESPDPYFQLGEAYQELGRHDLAIEALRKSIALNPELSHNKFQVTTAHYRLARSLLATGQTEAGQQELGLAAKLKAEAFTMEQQLAKGATMGSSRLPEQDEQPSAESAAAPDAKALEELERAEAYYTKVLAAAHSNIGQMRAQRGDFPTAVEQFRLAAKWDPRQPGLDFNLGLAHYRSDSYAEAATALEREVRANPGNTPARWLLGLSSFHLRDYAKAADLLADVPASGSRNAELHVALASSLLELGDAARAIESFEAAARLDPENPLVHERLGQAYAAAGRLDEAAREREIANRLKQTSPR